MSIHYLENDVLKIAINSKGAELESIYNKQTKLDYLWDANPKFWPKKSPNLFPIIGGLKNTEYTFDEKKYNLGRHGFARDNDYLVEEIDAANIKFSLLSNEQTKTNYPFDFIFSIVYSIESNTLKCKYVVQNVSVYKMYFSVGAHPAFRIPLTNNTSYDDWYLEFEQIENADLFPLDETGLIKLKSVPFFNDNKKISLTKDLFYKDALVFKNLKSTQIDIKSNKSENGLKIEFKGFPYFGIWSAKDADFVCLEPWCGIADIENTDGNLINKEGINMLESNEIFEREWTVELY
jgi:galactose mutarotase-like enzyme